MGGPIWTEDPTCDTCSSEDDYGSAGRAQRMVDDVNNVLISVHSKGRLYIALLGATNLGSFFFFSFFFLFFFFFFSFFFLFFFFFFSFLFFSFLFFSFLFFSFLFFSFFFLLSHVYLFPGAGSYFASVQYGDLSYSTTVTMGPTTEWNEEFCLLVEENNIPSTQKLFLTFLSHTLSLLFLSFSLFSLFSSLVTDTDSNLVLELHEIERKKKKKADVILGSLSIRATDMKEGEVVREVLSISPSRKGKGPLFSLSLSPSRSLLSSFFPSFFPFIYCPFRGVG